MRLFVALELPSALRNQLATLSAEVRPRLPAARWVPEGNLHLTLYFLGEMTADERQRLERALRPVFAGAPAFALSPRGAGTFPAGRRARVAWVGFAAQPALERLQAAVSSTICSALDREPEHRPFRAHLTMARCKSPWARPAQRAWSEQFAERELDPFQVGQGVLMESRLQPTGAVYTVASAYPLRPAEAGG